MNLSEFETEYLRLTTLATQGEEQCQVAENGLFRLLSVTDDGILRARIQNDLGVIAAVAGLTEKARAAFEAASALAPEWELPRQNRRQLDSASGRPAHLVSDEIPKQKVAILSLLFNWPSTGGGTVHTAETGKFLTEAGFDVRHFFAQFDEWGIGNVSNPLLASTEAIRFTADTWNVSDIRSRFREVLQAFQPDWVIITDSWNSKPVLAEAAAGFRFFLRIAAQECLCPLNNVRLLFENAQIRSCPKHQLATPNDCCQCVAKNGMNSGELHRAERQLVDYGSQQYDDKLRWAMQAAEAVLVVNPLIGTMVSPYAKRVFVIPSGLDAARFPVERAIPRNGNGTAVQILFAGLPQELMKGFAVLYEACCQLWRKRQDFQLAVTSEPIPGISNPLVRFIGWQSQESLPAQLYDADVLVVPTIAEEALGRTAVEAMAAGRPVIASRIGGLQFTVVDGATGLLFEPGDIVDLQRKLELLIDDPALRNRLGAAGRRRFEEHYDWRIIVDRFYKPLFQAGALTAPAAPKLNSVAAPAIAIPAAQAVAPTAKLGCVLAIRDRDPGLLERAFQTYRWQTYPSIDRVLVDYGSEKSMAAIYGKLCRQYGWRLLRADPAEPRWHLSAAYNLAVSALRDEVDTVFKSDIDVLLGPEVLSIAAENGRDSFCQFQYVTIPKETGCPQNFSHPDQLTELFSRTGKTRPSAGQGLFACPKTWFQKIGGFDLAYKSWGYEDHDLRLRAERSIPVIDIDFRAALMLHQWHPPAAAADAVDDNLPYLQKTAISETIVRNEGQLKPPNVLFEDRKAGAEFHPQLNRRIVVATRSHNRNLTDLSGEFLHDPDGRSLNRVCIENADALDYFKRLANLDADWVINLDEDAFLLDPAALFELIDFMEQNEYAACGMPDGGVVAMRRHNPVVCNACFSIFDLRRVRPVWSDWSAVNQIRHRPEFETSIAPFAARTAYAFDDFEPYYCVFFALLAAAERIFFLDADTWRDGVTTMIRGLNRKPLLLHGWYAREWSTDRATRQRFARIVEYIRDEWSHSSAQTCRSGSSIDSQPRLATTLVGICVFDRLDNIKRWLSAWRRSNHGGAKLFVVHNQDQPDPSIAEVILEWGADVYIPRHNIGLDIGAFQDVAQGRYAHLLPTWEQLLWCTDDFLPLHPDFLLRFLDKAADSKIGLVAGRYGYWPGDFSGLSQDLHCRTVGFLIKRHVAERLMFPAPRVTSRQHCMEFEHGPGHLMQQVHAMGYQTRFLDDAEVSVMWDTHHEDNLDRWARFDLMFSEGAARKI